MENINPFYILQPVIVIAISVALMLYWYKKRRFHSTVWLYTLVAYAVAIALKYAVQIPTIDAVKPAGDAVLGVYYGVQTMVFEVGLAYLVAYLAAKHGNLSRKDAEAYGSGLAFWENAGLLGALSLVNLVSYYFILSGGGPLAQTVYDQLQLNAPGLFSSNVVALGNVGIGVWERMSSMLIHIAWGYLCVMAVLYHKRKLFLIALPMGFIDFLVPFAQYSPLVFEGVFFGLSVLSIWVAWYTTKAIRKQPEPTHPLQSSLEQGTGAATLPTGNSKTL
ncbi:MAG: YhfC family glutamic-type intramembrane protease [Candidatus Bathyarchaeia archaeon]|jgi:hypothetical protein